MKTFIHILFFLGLNIVAFSQSKISTDEGIINADELPAIVIKNAGEAFSIYIPDNHPDKEVRELQKKFIAYEIGKDYLKYDNYLLILETKSGTLAAKYNSKGKLLGVVEKYEDIRLPKEVLHSIYDSYPEWTIMKDKYYYSQKDGNIEKKQYKLTIQNQEKTKMLTVLSNGEIIKE